MSTVLLANAYLYKLDPKQWNFRQPYPPLGTLQAAAVLRKAGYSTRVADMSLADSPDALGEFLVPSAPSHVILYEDGFNYLTKMCLTVMRDAAFKMARQANARGCTVIINSSDASDHYEKYLDEGVSYVIRGEGEETLLELLHCLSQNESPAHIPGIAFRNAHHTVVNPTRPVLRDLDALPLPAWDLIDLQPYRELWKNAHGYFSLNVATTRGCPYKCNWCAKPIYGNRYHSRSPEHVIREIEMLMNLGHPDHFWMADDIFGLKPNWVREFAHQLQKRKLSIRYKIQSRVDLLLEPDSIQSLAASGCDMVWVGAESGSQKILDAMDKGTTVVQIRQATRLLRQHGIRVGYFLQFGYPGEMREDIDATLQLVLEEMPDEIGISVSYPLPGTKFYEKVKAELREKQNWTDSDDLAMMYTSTYPQAYYKVLQRFVHSQYRIQRGLNRVKELMRKPHPTRKDPRKLASMIINVPISWIHAYRLRKLSMIHA